MELIRSLVSNVENSQSGKKKTSSAIVTSMSRYFDGVTFRRIELYRRDGGKTTGVSYSAREIRPLVTTLFFSWGNRYKNLALQLCINRSLWLAYQLRIIELAFFFSLSPWPFTQLPVNVHAHF